jgi:hypothetical protein
MIRPHVKAKVDGLGTPPQRALFTISYRRNFCTRATFAHAQLLRLYSAIFAEEVAFRT